MLNYLTIVLMAPVVIIQGIYLRKTAPKLEEAAGERKGVTGKGERLRLLVVGDSAAAGVGVNEQSEALAGHVVNELCVRFRLDWSLLAKSGHTTQDAHDMLRLHPKRKFDVVVISLGVNDVTKAISASEWLEQQMALIAFIREHFSCRQIVLTKIPPMEQFPALPYPLGWYLGMRSSKFNEHLHSWIGTQDDCVLLDLNDKLQQDKMAVDGFHPGPEIYQFWGQSVAEVIKTRWD